MSETFTAEWYDAALTGPDAPSMLPLETSPWREMYEQLAAMIEGYEEVVDLGCGTGRFLELLARNGHYAKRTGIDWSPAAILEAERYCGGYSDFQRENLADWQPDPDRAGNTVFVCSEVLEHLAGDLGLVRRVPPGHRFLFTVPNFHSESHLRTFPAVGDLWERYSGLVTFRSWRMVGTERHGIHVVESMRRVDAW